MRLPKDCSPSPKLKGLLPSIDTALLPSHGSSTSLSPQVLSAATIVAKHTSALCHSCRLASARTANPTAKRQFVQSAKEVANSTANLVKTIKVPSVGILNLSLTCPVFSPPTPAPRHSLRPSPSHTCLSPRSCLSALVTTSPAPCPLSSGGRPGLPCFCLQSILSSSLSLPLQALDGAFTEENRAQCRAATAPLLEAVDNLSAFASNPEFSSVPAQISPEVRQGERMNCRPPHLSRSLETHPSTSPLPRAGLPWSPL